MGGHEERKEAGPSVSARHRAPTRRGARQARLGVGALDRLALEFLIRKGGDAPAPAAPGGGPANSAATAAAAQLLLLKRAVGGRLFARLLGSERPAPFFAVPPRRNETPSLLLPLPVALPYSRSRNPTPFEKCDRPSPG